jgi:hypothetical protein
MAGKFDCESFAEAEITFIPPLVQKSRPVGGFFNRGMDALPARLTLSK